MRYLKKMLFYLMIILTFTISFSNEENRITIYERENEPAKLKIGVTKLLTKELAMDFDPEKKIIYCEVPEEVTENDSIYVSETLDEIPSTSTTNGRKTINNINKYLTKDIKANANFNYRVVDVNDEATGEVKKYLVINCKNPISSVYLYIVENGTYKMKGLYRGKFAVLNSVKEEKNYGTIEITENIFDRHEYRRISATSSNTAIISKLSQFGVKDDEASKHIQVLDYPQKLKDGTKFAHLLHLKPYYKVEVYSNNSSKPIVKSEDRELKGKNKNEIDVSFDEIGNSEAKEATKMIIVTDSTSEYYYIYITQPSPYEDVNYKIVVTYGQYDTILNKFVVNKTETHKFYLRIPAKEKPILPHGTKGNLYLFKTKHSEVGAMKDAVVSFEDTEVKLDNEKLFKSPNFTGERVEILDYSKPEYNAVFPEGNENFLRISYTSNGEGENKTKWTKDLNFKDIILNNNINITESKFNKSGKVSIYDKYNLKLGDLVITGTGKSGEKSYFKLKFLSNFDDFKKNQWPDTHRDVISTLTFEYITKKGDNEIVLKTDTLNIIIYPVPEVIAPETYGTLLITNSFGLPGKDLFIRDGVLGVEKNKDNTTDIFDTSNVSISGELPVGFASNNEKSDNWVNIEHGYRLRIKGLDVGGAEGIETENPNKTSEEFNYKTGAFKSETNDNNGWIELNTKQNIGYMYISYGGVGHSDKKESITLGFRYTKLDTALGKEEDFDWHKKDKGLYKKIKFEYQVNLGNKWETIKTDTLNLIIQRGLEVSNPKITLANPLVYYDYDSSSAISNIVHNRRAHISSEAPKTLNKNGSNFIKNRDLDGNEWIETENVSDYEWERLGKHKLSITRGKNEVLKNTNDDGGTKSSTYLSGDKSINGTKNEIMFSYDGGNKYLNFGVSKYNFKGETIKDVAITHFQQNGEIIESREVYTIEIPRFEGIHYMGNYDISPRKSYTKNYEYNQALSNKEPVIIDYGTIGFRNLDTRITNQSGGEGIDFRATRKVKLVSEDGIYVIKGAELFFEKDESDDNNETTLFKGENEKATSAMLKLKIPAQETLIPQGRFTILTDNGADDIDNNPLRIGVTVNGEKKEYYTYIDGEKEGSEGENLYLNITTNRYIETTIEFENPEFATKNIGDVWVRLNKSDYPTGELIGGNINGSLLWGRVRGEVIDIPVEYNGKKYDNLILQVFQGNPNDSESEVSRDLTNNKVEFKIPNESKDINGEDKHFIIKYDKGNNFIEFSLDKGYDYTIQNREDIVFYIRYIDGSKEENKGFLFDQKYIVKFKDKAEYKGDITVRFKNPSMAKIDINNEVKGIIDLITKSYVTGGNHDTGIDSIDWVDIGISQDTINKIKEDFTGDNYTLTNIENGNNAKDLIIQLDKNQFKIALSNSNTDFRSIFGADYDGNEIDNSFSLQFDNSDEEDSKAYRLNIIIDKFDPKYYGKVFRAENDTDIDPDTTEYKEINLIGDGAINLTETNVKEDGFVYVDLNTSYRDYMRYKALPTVLLKGGDLKITLPKDVEAIPRNSNYAKPVKGDIVLLDETDPKNKYKDEKEVDPTKDGTNIPKNYPLKLKLSLVEYQKLRPYTKYEIYKNGNYNVLTIGVEKEENLKNNIIMDKPLNFYADGGKLEIINGILDFGKIVPESLPNKLNSISGTTNQNATINIDNKRESRSITITLNPLDNNLGNVTRNLELEGDITWIKQLSAAGQPMENGGTLKVRDLAVEKSSTTEGAEATNQVITETYDVSGILEVPKNIERSKYGSYEGTIILHYTFY